MLCLKITNLNHFQKRVHCEMILVGHFGISINIELDSSCEMCPLKISTSVVYYFNETNYSYSISSIIYHSQKMVKVLIFLL